MSKNRVSRRQFLNYTLTGVGGFMAAGMLMPMVRFAVDPVLQAKAESDYVPTDTKVDKITDVPTRVDFAFEQQDAWYTSKESGFAWVYKDDKGEIVALSPVCKHLGCVVDWNTDKSNQDHFYCPCHGGLYTKDGTNVKGTPPIGPLDVYSYIEKDGFLHLGKAEPRKGA